MHALFFPAASYLTVKHRLTWELPSIATSLLLLVTEQLHQSDCDVLVPGSRAFRQQLLKEGKKNVK